MDLSDAQMRQRALSRWEDEGGAPSRGRQEKVHSTGTSSALFLLTNASVAQLRVSAARLDHHVSD